MLSFTLKENLDPIIPQVVQFKCLGLMLKSDGEMGGNITHVVNEMEK